MFRKLLHACAAIALTGASVCAADLSGTYCLKTPQGQSRLEIHPDHTWFSGTLHAGGVECPVIVSDVGDKLIGNYMVNARIVPFTGAFDGTTFTIYENGSAYAFQRETAPAVNNDNRDPQPQEPIMQPNNPQPAAPQQPTIEVQIQQGRYFSFPVPQGWQVSETDSGVDLRAPDGMTVVSHCLTRGLGQFSPDQAFQMIMQWAPQAGISNVRVLSRQPIQAAGTAQAAVFVLSYDYRGMPVHAVNVYTVQNQWGGYMLDVMSLQGPPTTLQPNLPFYTQLAQNVVVINPNEVCGNNRLLRFVPPAPVVGSHSTSSNPIGDMIVKGEQERNRIRDKSFERTVDSIRGVTRWGADGSIVAPNTAERVFVTPGGTPIYSNHVNTPPPPNATEVERTR